MKSLDLLNMSAQVLHNVSRMAGLHFENIAEEIKSEILNLSLAFSLQAAYAAPLILLAQTRQADRDKVHSEADALHWISTAVIDRANQITRLSESVVPIVT